MMESYKLTQFSHGAGCGCKISPEVLDQIISGSNFKNTTAHLLVGHESKDDAAVYSFDELTAIISTTDFFMPIVDDAFDFGAIAATNAISDIYAMGGKPMMAVAILGWPIDKLPVEIAKQVVEGGRFACSQAGIPLAGGHSIDTQEPIFGLAVTGSAPIRNIKKNSTAKAGDLLYLTKPLGVGLVTTAQKRGLAAAEDLNEAIKSMMQLNKVGELLGGLDYVHALTDVTGFGLAGHLLEICEGSKLYAEIESSKIPTFSWVQKYLDLGCNPGGTTRNWKSYGHKISLAESVDYRLVADPQTSGGLLVTVDPKYSNAFETEILKNAGLQVKPIGQIHNSNKTSLVTVF